MNTETVLTPELFRSMLKAVRDEERMGHCRACGAGAGEPCKEVPAKRGRKKKG